MEEIREVFVAGILFPAWLAVGLMKRRWGELEVKLFGAAAGVATAAVAINSGFPVVSAGLLIAMASFAVAAGVLGRSII